MPRLSDEELERIIQEGMPGYTVVSRGGEGTPAGPAPPTDQVAADIHELRERYLDEPAADAAVPEPELDAEAEEDEEVVTVRPAGAADPLNQGAGPKKVIVSAAEGRIIGSQG